MGCGCGRRKKKSLSARRMENARNRSKELTSAKLVRAKAEKFRSKVIKTRLSICEKCSHSTQTSRDKKYNVRICHKQNRPIDVVSKTLSVACPVSKFKVLT